MSMTERTGRFRAGQERPADVVPLGADSGADWVLFAGIMIGLLAAMNLVYGIAAVSDSKVFVANAEFVLSGLHTWGWTLILISVIQAGTAIGVFVRWPVARWTGVAIAFVNAIVQTLMIPAFPWWSIAL